MKNRRENSWRRRSLLQKILLVLLVLLLCLVLVLFVVLVLQFGRLFKTSTTCTAPECIKAAAQIIDFIDPSVDPCDNFYDFVCGNFLKRSLETNEITAVSKLEAIVENQLNALITEPTPSNSLPAPLELQRRFYKNCLNTTAIDEDDNNAFLKLIAEVGDWPVLMGRFWNQKKFHWLNSMVKVRQLGFPYDIFLKVGQVEDDNVTKLFLLSISPPSVNNLIKEFSEPYIKLMLDVAIDLGAPQLAATEEEIIRVYNFEKRLTDIIENSTVGENDEIFLTVQQIKEKFRSIPWTEFLNNVTRTPNKFDSHSFIAFKCEKYLKELLVLLKQTPERTQANYMIWKIIESQHKFLKKSIRDRYHSFLVTVNPALLFKENREKFCFKRSQFYFPSVAEIAYVRKYMTPGKRAHIQEMVERIRREVINLLSTNTWMDEETKKIAEIRIRAIESYIGSSEAVYDEDFNKLVEMKGFDLPTDNIIEMTTKLYVKKQDNYFAIINRNVSEVTKLAIESSPILQINAFYAPEFNTLILPASFLQGIIYNFKRPNYINYGSLGSIIGHEFTHGLTTRDNETEEDWWSPETVKKFEERTQCLLEEYQNYTDHLEGFTKHGGEALQENLADFVGPNLAYRAYMKYIEERGEEKKLPGLEYTPKQIFWIMFGTFKCYQPKLRIDKHQDEEHGVPSFGVSGSVKNSLYFAEDFNCKLGSNMSPINKCQVL